jgi:hypothetical protein
MAPTRKIATLVADIVGYGQLPAPTTPFSALQLASDGSQRIVPNRAASGRRDPIASTGHHVRATRPGRDRPETRWHQQRCRWDGASEDSMGEPRP